MFLSRFLLTFCFTIAFAVVSGSATAQSNEELSEFMIQSMRNSPNLPPMAMCLGKSQQQVLKAYEAAIPICIDNMDLYDESVFYTCLRELPAKNLGIEQAKFMRCVTKLEGDMRQG